MTRPYNLDKAREFLDSVEGDWGIVFDKDCDGITSAALITKYMEERGTEPTVASAKDGSGIHISDELMISLQELDTVIFCDMPLDQSDILEELEEQRVMFIDHHLPEEDMNSERVLHINPRFGDEEVYRPTAWLAWELTKPLSRDYSWLAAVGVFADYGLADCKDLIDHVAEEYPELVVEDRYDQKAMLESGIGMLSKVMTAAYGVENSKGATESFRVSVKAEKPSDVTSSRLIQYFEEFQKALEEESDRFEREATYFQDADAYLHEVRSRYKVMSIVTTKVSEKHPDAVVLCHRDSKTHTEISARCQSGRVNVAELMKELVDGIGEGGGHPQAAGAGVPLEHKEEFMSRVRRKLTEI